MLLAPAAARWRSFPAWETGGTPLDPEWTELVEQGAAVRTAWPVMPRRPAPDELRAFDVPTLVVLAVRSRAVDPVAAQHVARDALGAETVVLPGQSHHTLPTHEPAALNTAVTRFLDVQAS